MKRDYTNTCPLIYPISFNPHVWQSSAMCHFSMLSYILSTCMTAYVLWPGQPPSTLVRVHCLCNDTFLRTLVCDMWVYLREVIQIFVLHCTRMQMEPEALEWFFLKKACTYDCSWRATHCNTRGKVNGGGEGTWGGGQEIPEPTELYCKTTTTIIKSPIKNSCYKQLLLFCHVYSWRNSLK